MKSLFLVLFLSAVALAQQTEKVLIPLDAKFSPDAVISQTKDSMSPESRELLRSKFVPKSVQSGSINGVKFRFYHADGSGRIEGVKDAGIELRSANSESYINGFWGVQCKKDPIDDSKQCAMIRGDLIILKSTKLGTAVSLIGDKNPGSEIAIRVDSKPAFTAPETGGFVGKRADEVIAALSNGEKVVTRYVRWPQQTSKDSEHGLYGFKEALAYLNWALSQIK